MSDVATKAHSTITTVNNGGMVVLVTETGECEKSGPPEINQFIPSGTLFDRYKDRFDEYYGGPPT